METSHRPLAGEVELVVGVVGMGVGAPSPHANQVTHYTTSIHPLHHLNSSLSNSICPRVGTDNTKRTHCFRFDLDPFDQTFAFSRDSDTMDRAGIIGRGSD